MARSAPSWSGRELLGFVGAPQNPKPFSTNEIFDFGCSFLARLGATLAVTVRNLAQLWAPWWRDLGAKRAPMEREERNKEKNKKEESNKERKKKERKRNMTKREQ